MKIFVYAIFLFYSALVFGQEYSPFDALEANQGIQNSFSAVNQINGYATVPGCKTIKGTNGEAVAECSVNDEDYNTAIVKADYSKNNMPDMLKNILPKNFIEDVHGKNVSCFFRFKMMNDSQRMSGKDVGKGSQKLKYGDDYGRTHGVEVGVSCLSQDGVSSAFSYSTELYTDPDLSSARYNQDRNKSMKQKFSSENIFSFLQDNINEGKVTYWKKGVGLINLSQKKKWGLMQSTGQQQWWHDVLNDSKPGRVYNYDYIEGSQDKWGAFVTLAIGLQENRKFGDRCKLHMYTDIGARLSSLNNTSIAQFNAGAKLSYQLTNHSDLYLKVDSEESLRSSGLIKERTLATGFENKKIGFEVGTTIQDGNRKDVPDGVNVLTKKNDKLIFVRVKYKY